MELKRFFDRAVRASFYDLALRGDPAAPYLSDLLTRFARIENLYPRGTAIPRLETVVDMTFSITDKPAKGWTIWNVRVSPRRQMA